MKTKRTYPPRMPAIACPHCQSRAIVRNSCIITDLVRELRMVCDNVDCGHVFVAQLSVIKTLRPADRPNASVMIPFGTWRGEARKPANDDYPPPANDDDDAGGDRGRVIGIALGALYAPPT